MAPPRQKHKEVEKEAVEEEKAQNTESDNYRIFAPSLSHTTSKTKVSQPLSLCVCVCVCVCEINVWWGERIQMWLRCRGGGGEE